MTIQSTKSYSFFRAHLLESQRLHLLGLVLATLIFFGMYGWHWPSQALWLMFLTVATIMPFSWVYWQIDRAPLPVEARYRHLVRVALIQSWLDLLLITLGIHLTGGYASALPLLYILQLGSISVFYPTRLLVNLNLWAITFYTGLMRAYQQGWLPLVHLPNQIPGVLERQFAFQIWAIYVTAILVNWLIIARHARKVQAAWHSADEQNQYLDDLHGLTRLGLEHLELSQLYQTLANEIHKILGADFIYLTRWDAESELVHPEAAAGEDHTAYLATPPASRRETSMTQSVHNAGKALVARNVYCSPYLAPKFAEKCPAKSLLGLPLYGLPDRHFLGALLVAYRTTHDFSVEELERATQLAEVAALLISRTRLYHETQHRAVLLEQLAGQVTSLTLDLRRTSLLPAIVESARGLLHAERAALHLYNQETQKMNCEYSLGLSAEYLEYMSNNFEASPEADTFHDQNFVLIPDVFRDARTDTLRTIITREQFRAYAVFGLESLQGNLGTLSLYWDQPHAISSAEVSVGQLFAQRAGAMLYNVHLYEQVAEESLTDVLTGLPNRRYFDRRFAEEIERSKRYGHPFSLLMLDLDGFKTINDTFGHAIGDSVIKQISSALLRTVRSTDMVARFGGDEFALIVPEADRDAAIHLAEKIRRVLAATKLHLPNDTQRHLSACAGIAVYPVENEHAKGLFELADQRMYRAKRKGLGSVIFDEN